MSVVFSTTEPSVSATTKQSMFVEWNANFLHLQIGFFIGIGCYTIYIFLLFTRIPKLMLAYRRVLLLHSIIDLHFIFVNLFLNGAFPCLGTDRGLKCFRLLTGYFTYTPRFWPWLSAILGQISIAWEVPGVSVTFLYRYLMICRNKQLGNGAFLSIAAASYLAPAIIEVILDAHRKWPKPEDLYYDKYFQGPEWVFEGRFPTYVVSATPYNAFENFALWIPSYIGYGIIIASTIAIIRTLRFVKSTNPKHKRMQLELSIVLWIQAFLPLPVYIIPTTAQAIGFKFDSSFVRYFTKSSIWIPAVNVILSCFIITPFRQFFINIFSRCCPSNAVGNGMDDDEDSRKNTLSRVSVDPRT